jgi:cytochrome c-type biogenesis protein
VGPTLAAILSAAALSESAGHGALLLGFYSAGLAVPFLVAAMAVESFLGWFQRFRRFLPWVMRVSGVLLVFVGILLLTGEFTRLAGWLQGLTPEFLREKL